MIDADVFGKQMGALVRDSIAPLLDRIKALESVVPERGEAGPAGIDGRDGIDGKDGESIKGDAGADGKDGRDGKDAEPILLSDVAKELLTMPELAALVALQVAEGVAEYMKANPPRDGVDGKNGRDGADGKDGQRGEVGEKGMQGEPGKDGAGITDLLIDREGALVATFTDGRMKSLGVIVGKDGQNGKDGLSVESIERTYDADAHEIVERWTALGQAKELRYPAGGISHGGYWRENMKCAAGSTWTHAGTVWIATKETGEKPSREAKDWMVFASKGSDGRDGRNGRDLGPMPPVKLGA